VQTKKENEMKKLMILAAVAMVSAIASAAQIKWGSGTVYTADSTKAGKDAVTAYLFLIDSTTYGTLAANTTGTAMSDAVYAAYGANLASASATASTTAKGVANLTDPTVYGNGDTAYAAILYVEGDNYMGNVGTYTLTSDMDYTVAGMSTTIFGSEVGTTATAWSTAAVPEPTSGLLLLLGMAGLALKRKHA